MWLLTVVGPVHGQNQFTFALEQKREYKIGRNKNGDICISSARVRPSEGVLVVGDWDPTRHTTPPKLVFKYTAKKDGSFPPLTTLRLKRGEELGSAERDSYDDLELTNTGEVEFDNLGKGVAFNNAWLIAQWQPLHITYGLIKNADDSKQAKLRSFCVSWNEAFDEKDLPDYVISSVLKGNSNECNLAVCYGIPIVSEEWFADLAVRLGNCWKTSADSQDSFSIPTHSMFQPKLDPSLPKARNNLEVWQPNTNNRTMFSEWGVLGLKTRTGAMREKIYFEAMGAQYNEIDISKPSIQSPAEFLARIQPYQAQAASSGRTFIAVYFAQTRKQFEGDDPANKGKFDQVVFQPCQKEGVFLCSGLVLWGSVAMKGVTQFLEFVAGPGPDGNTAQQTSTALQTGQVETKTGPLEEDKREVVEPAPNSSVVEPAGKASGRLPRRAGTRQASRALSEAPSEHPEAVPSSVPEDSMAVAAPAEEVPVPIKQASPPPAPTPTVPDKKPLRRRAGRTRIMDLDDELDEVPANDPPDSYRHPAAVPETLFPMDSQPESAQSRVPDSMEVDVVDPPPVVPPPVAPPPRTSRLKRRAGATQTTFLDGLDTTINFEEQRRKREAEEEIRQLYEETKGESMASHEPVAKRPRREGSAAPKSTSRAQSVALADLMEVDEDDDYVAKAIRSAKVKKEVTSPVKRQVPRKATVVQSEESEEIEEHVEERPPAPGTKVVKTAKKSGTQKPDQDVAFQEALKKAAKGKKALDDLDKEFAALELPKQGRSKARATLPVKPSVRPVWEPPDYALVNDFDDDLRGNFIEIVRKDLFRKDGGHHESEPATSNGKPNFKKFKKKNIVRREPIPMTLNGQANSAEMGEPYWHTTAKTQQTQRPHSHLIQPSAPPRGTLSLLDDDEDMPLVPERRHTRIVQDDNDDDEDNVVLRPATKRARGVTPAVSEGSRRSRTGSTVSDSVAPATSTRRAASKETSKSTAKATSTQRGRRGTQAEVLVIDDSDDDDSGAFATAQVASTTTTRRTRTTATPTTATVSRSRARSTTLDVVDEDEDDVMTSMRGSRSMRSTRAQRSGTSPAPTAPRRRLLVEDDDDNAVAFKGVQKRRRIA